MAETDKQDQEQVKTDLVPETFDIAVLPLQNTTLFPETVVPLAVGRDRSKKAVEAAPFDRRKAYCLYNHQNRERDR